MLTQLRVCYNTLGRFPNLSDALDKSDFQEPSIVENKNTHSIWQILKHLFYWNNQIQQRIKISIAQLEPSIKNDLTFKEQEDEKTESSWEATTKRVHRIFAEWIEMVTNATDDRVNSQVSDKDTRLWWQVISYLNIHNRYHIGQMTTLRKIQRIGLTNIKCVTLGDVSLN